MKWIVDGKNEMVFVFLALQMKQRQWERPWIDGVLVIDHPGPSVAQYDVALGSQKWKKRQFRGKMEYINISGLMRGTTTVAEDKAHAKALRYSLYNATSLIIAGTICGALVSG